MLLSIIQNNLPKPQIVDFSLKKNPTPKPRFLLLRNQKLLTNDLAPSIVHFTHSHHDMYKTLAWASPRQYLHVQNIGVGKPMPQATNTAKHRVTTEKTA